MAISARGDNALQQAFHDDLGTRAVERANQGQRQDAVPKFDHRRREFQQFLLLAGDHILADPRIAFDGVQAQPIDQTAGDPCLLGEQAGIRGDLLAQQLKQRLLEREHHDGGFARTVALDGPVA